MLLFLEPPLVFDSSSPISRIAAYLFICNLKIFDSFYSSTVICVNDMFHLVMLPLPFPVGTEMTPDVIKPHNQPPLSHSLFGSA